MDVEVRVGKEDLIVSKTDIRGRIVYANDAFCKYAGYRLEELVGQPHSILRHKDMPSKAFESLWNTIKDGRLWQGIVKNRTKKGDYYWVSARVFPIVNRMGETEYISVRTAINDDEKRNTIKLYKEMISK